MLNNGIPKLASRDTMGPAVTIVMPTFRRAHAIGESIKSLLQGRWTDFELLVRDDGDGSDGTEQAVAAAANGDSRVLYHRNHKNMRMPGNLNAGIEASRGEFIAVCHDHDIYTPAFIETMVKTLQRHPSALFVHCAIEVISQGSELIQTHVADWPDVTAGATWLKFMLRSLNCPVCALTVVRREAHEQYGLYDPSYGFIADVEMWMRLSNHGDVAYVRDPLIQVREREDDHVETKNSARNVRIAVDINRRYLPYAYDRRERVTHRLRLEAEVIRRSLRNELSRFAHALARSG